jgi:hypothetical protein
MAATKQSTRLTLNIGEAERAELLVLLERAQQETRVEARRTESPDYQDAVHREESVLKGLLEKVRRL